MVTLATLVTHPRWHILDDDQFLLMPKVFAPPLRCQAADTAPRANLTG